MKIKIIYLLLGVTFFARSMEQQAEVIVHEEIITNLSLLKRTIPHENWLRRTFEDSLKLLPSDIKRMLFDLVSEDETLEKAVANYKALARICKSYWDLFCFDENINSQAILKWEKRLPIDPAHPLNDSQCWRVFTIVKMLNNEAAKKWFAKQNIYKLHASNIEKLDNEQRASLKEALLKINGGFTISEHQFLDLRPVKVLEKQPHVLNGAPRGPITRALSLKSCALRNLAGIERIQDLATVELLDLSGNNLSQMEKSDLIRFTNLTRLDMAYNNMGAVDLSLFASLAHLRSLDFSSNKIKRILCDIPFQTVELQSIDLSGNAIEYVDPQLLAKFPARIIDLSKNPLQNREELTALSKPMRLIKLW